MSTSWRLGRRCGEIEKCVSTNGLAAIDYPDGHETKRNDEDVRYGAGDLTLLRAHDSDGDIIHLMVGIPERAMKVSLTVRQAERLGNALLSVAQDYEPLTEKECTEKYSYRCVG